MIDTIPLNTVQAAVPDVADDNAGTAVAAPVADIAGAAADTAVAAADVAAAVDSAGNLYRRACRVYHHCGLHVPHSVRSGRRFWLETSGQGMATFSPI